MPKTTMLCFVPLKSIMVKKALSVKSVMNRKESKILFLLMKKEVELKLQLQIKLGTFLYITFWGRPSGLYFFSKRDSLAKF